MPGPEEFEAGLSSHGFRTRRRGHLVVVRVDPPLGPAAGTFVEVGTDPPPDYPRIPPHWVHLPVRFELSGGGRDGSELGAEWSKWSRPHPRWRGGSGAANQWLGHVRALLAEATIA
jgi:hypothetical protein